MKQLWEITESLEKNITVKTVSQKYIVTSQQKLNNKYMNIQQFLEEETQNITQYAYFVEHQSEEGLSGVIREHNSRIINKVLSEVKREVENVHTKYFDGIASISEYQKGYLQAQINISTIIDQLKLK